MPGLRYTPGVLIYCTNKRRSVYSAIYGISCWSGVQFTIMCVRTQKFLSYASSAIFRTCYSLSVRKNCLTYVQPSRYISMERPWPTMGCCPKCRQFIEYQITPSTMMMLHEQAIRTENVQYLSESSILNHCR